VKPQQALNKLHTQPRAWVKLKLKDNLKDRKVVANVVVTAGPSVVTTPGVVVK
jgi:hypothetical protein